MAPSPSPAAPMAAFLVIGNEILSGRTQDVNVAALAGALAPIGIPLREVRVVPDEQPAIVAALDALRATHDYVFTSGGLGPTHDDITSAAVAAAFGVEVTRHAEALELLTRHYARHDLPFNEARRTMADVPAGATLVANPISAAPGFRIGNVISLAGVPNIFRAMLDDVLPTLKGGARVHVRSFRTGLPEGVVAGPLRALQDDFENVDIGSYPRFAVGAWATTLVLRSTDTAALDRAGQAVVALVAELGGTPEEE